MSEPLYPKNEFAWLIESDVGGAPTYWNGVCLAPDHNCAVRFLRKEDAQRVIDGGRAGSVLGNTVARICKAVEHGWAAPPQPEPTGEAHINSGASLSDIRLTHECCGAVCGGKETAPPDSPARKAAERIVHCIGPVCTVPYVEGIIREAYAPREAELQRLRASDAEDNATQFRLADELAR